MHVKLVPASDSSLLIVFGESIEGPTQNRVLDMFFALQSVCDKRVRNLHPAYTSLLVDFDPLVMTHEEASMLVESLEPAPVCRVENQKTVEIPVCYDAECGPDLMDVAQNAQLSMSEVIRLHASAHYTVSFLGFTGGFAYLSGMPMALSMPRLATPRRAVAAGSVGIAGGQTGIYPTVTPGGWRLIGRTPLRMFDPQRSQPSLLMPGDRVRFVTVDGIAFERLQLEQA